MNTFSSSWPLAANLGIRTKPPRPGFHLDITIVIFIRILRTTKRIQILNWFYYNGYIFVGCSSKIDSILGYSANLLVIRDKGQVAEEWFGWIHATALIITEFWKISVSTIFLRQQLLFFNRATLERLVPDLWYTIMVLHAVQNPRIVLLTSGLDWCS